MIKKVAVLVLMVSLLIVGLGSGLARADSGLTVLNSSAVMDFPLSLNFSLSAASDVNITDIRLHYRVDRLDPAVITSEVYLQFAPATSLAVQWSWDMRKTGGMPPGSSVAYWWTVADARGSVAQTDPVSIPIEDNRYEWHNLVQGKVTLYWYSGNDAFGRELMAVTQQALARLAGDTGAELEKPVKIYIYASSSDLLGSMIYPQEWTGGVTFTEYGIIAIGIAPDDLDWGRRAIAHELTHLVIHQVTFNPFSDLPTWLDEGLAMNAEGELDPLSAGILRKAITQDSLISVHSLSSPFSAYAEESVLGYAESYSLVKFLIDKHGQEKMFELLNVFRQGSGYDEALTTVYGFDMDGLDDMWIDYITAGTRPVQPMEKETPPILIGIFAGLAGGLFLGLSLFLERWAWRRGW